MGEQRMKTFFLSASIPDPKRDPRFFETADVVAIGDAVHALCSVVLAENRLVFGGHPAIIPIVQRVAALLGRPMSVGLYLSRFFEDKFPPEWRRFENVVLTEPGRDREHSIELMRARMLAAAPFAAGVFIGGMDGILEEWRLFRARHRQAAAWPIPTTGAAARMIFEDERLWDGRDRSRDAELGTERIYARLFRRLLALTPST